MQKKDSASITEPRLDPKKVQIGVQPIIWSNDDFEELGGGTSLDQCLAEMKAAGYVGTELGHKFPKDARTLESVLQKHGLELISGWHSAYLASRAFEEEKRDFTGHLDFLAALRSRVAIVAECTGRKYNQPEIPMGRDSCRGVLDRDDWKRLLKGLETFGKMAGDKGIKLAYHPHMGTVIENLSAIDRLMNETRSVGLLADTGHFFYAGIEPLEVCRQFKARIAHVHLKNIRPDVLREAAAKRFSFKEAVKRGVFTVPGDGGIDFMPLWRILAEEKYSGWLVVEAEQDPAKAPPFEYAQKARNYIRQTTGL